MSVIFGILDESGRRQFREVFLVIARKNGKTLLCAAIAAYDAFLGFQLDGDYGARIYFAAPKLDQAALCYDAFYQMIRQEPELEAITKKRRTDIYIESTNTSAKPLAFNAKKSDGLNISLAVLDEVASWQGEAGLRFYEVIKSSFGARREPLLLSITTAGYVHDGIYDDLMRRGTRVLLGGSDEARFLPVLYMIDDVEKWDDIDELKKANPNMGVSVSPEYFEEEIAIARGSLSRKAEFLCKYCNITQNSSTAWLSTQTVEKATGPALHLEDFARHYCVGGLDLSQTTDLTAACVVIEKAGTLYVFAKFWLPAEKLEEATARDGVPYAAYVQRGLLELSGDNFIDYRDCFKWFLELVKKYKLYPLKIGYDRYSAQYLIQDLRAAGYQCDDVYQGTNLHGVLQEVEGQLKDGRIQIGDNDLLKMHLLNSAIKMDVERGRGKLVKLDPKLHIDGTAALLDAMTVRQKYYGEIGRQLANTRRT